MKVSLNTVRALSNVPVDEDIDELVRKIGAQLGAVEEVVDYRPRYAGIVVAKVVSCIKHPNADKLSVCMIDDGGITPDVKRDDQGYVQVVCGAPNVREGLTVAWIPPGATVPTTFEGDPFVLEARELRGVVSNGMLASASELGISSDHSGLLEIDASDVGEDLARPGTAFGKLYGLDDVIIEIENKMFTHRPDCFGVLGVAREIAGIYGKEFENEDWYWKIPRLTQATGLKLEVDNQLPELVPRFMVVAMDNVQIGPSPIWMQALLSRIGVKSINNVVDLTNYYAYITAQPLHAYDYDKVAALTSDEGAKLIVRFPHEGEQVALLNGKTVTPRSEAIMIATDKELIGVGGVMGGTTTEVDENTKRIILECATFNMYSIRKTSMAHGLFTDAVTRFNKGQSPIQNNRVISEVARQVTQLAGGQQASDFCDDYTFKDGLLETNQTLHHAILITEGFINERLGMQLTREQIKTTLHNVNFACPDADDSDAFEVWAPFWRTDIALPEDVVEEVGRLIGFDKLPHELPLRSMSPSVIEPTLLLKKSLRSKLAAMGANELLTYSFVHGDLLKKSGQNPELAFKLGNVISPELQYYRLSLTPNLLSHVHQNIKTGHDKFALFEIGKVHCKSEMDGSGLPLEFGRLAMVFANKRSETGGYFTAKAYLQELLDSRFEVVGFSEELLGGKPILQQLIAPYDKTRSGLVVFGGEIVGVVGEFTLPVLKNYKLPVGSAGFEISLEALMENSETKYIPLSRYPGISQDICLEVRSDMSYSDVHKAVEAVSSEVIDPEVSSDVMLLDIFQADQSSKKRYTFRFNFVSYERTLQEKAISSQMDKLAVLMQERYDAVRI